MKEVFSVKGMSCAVCQKHVYNAVSALDGVDKVDVNLLTGRMTVEFDENKVAEEDVISSVEKAGFKAEIFVPSKKNL